jgi:hypothetical protein
VWWDGGASGGTRARGGGQRVQGGTIAGAQGRCGAASAVDACKRQTARDEHVMLCVHGHADDDIIPKRHRHDQCSRCTDGPTCSHAPMFDRPSLHLCMQHIHHVFPANQHAMPAATRERLAVPLVEQPSWIHEAARRRATADHVFIASIPLLSDSAAPPPLIPSLGSHGPLAALHLRS